jgi:hypothetical protein
MTNDQKKNATVFVRKLRSLHQIKFLLIIIHSNWWTKKQFQYFKMSFCFCFVFKKKKLSENAFSNVKWDNFFLSSFRFHLSKNKYWQSNDRQISTKQNNNELRDRSQIMSRNFEQERGSREHKFCFKLLTPCISVSQPVCRDAQVCCRIFQSVPPKS